MDIGNDLAHRLKAENQELTPWPLWGAAYVIHGGCSDDTLSDFRAALISRGQRAFEQALSAPDSLATEDFDEDAWFDAWFYEGSLSSTEHRIRIIHSQFTDNSFA